MSEPRRIELSLLGQTLAIRSEAPPDYLRRLAKYLEERVAQLKRSGVSDPVTALSLAALDITDELFRAREDKSRDEGDVGAPSPARPLPQLFELRAGLEGPTPLLAPATPTPSRLPVSVLVSTTSSPTRSGRVPSAIQSSARFGA